MTGVSHAEWLNENSSRAYPFMEDSTRRPSDGNGGLLPKEYALPNCALSDFVLTVPSYAHGMSFYLSGFTMVGGVATFVVSASSGSSSEVAASVSVSLSGGQNSWVPFGGSGRFADCRGAVVVGDPEKLASSIPDGAYSFDPGSTPFEPRCIRPALAGVSALVVCDSTGTPVSRRLQGDVSLISGANIRLRYDADRNAVWIDADPNAGYEEKCVCAEHASEIYTINGIAAENVQIEGGECIKIEKAANGVLRITDTCAKPCCGCAELSFLNQKTSEVSTSLSKLEDFSAALSTRIEELKTASLLNSLSVGGA